MTRLADGVYRRGRRLWIRFTVRGHEYRQPVDTQSVKKAGDIRVDEIAKVKRGERTAASEKLTGADLLALVKTDYAANRRRSWDGVKGQIAAVVAAVGHVRASDITTELVQRVQLAWRETGASNGTINRRCNFLRRGFRLALQARLLHLVPYIPRLKEPKRRAKYQRQDDVAAFTEHLPTYVVPVFRFGTLNGTRRGQLVRTQRRFVDLTRALIEWPPDEVKADETHILPLDSESLALVKAQMKLARPWCPYLFHGPRCAPGRKPSKRYACVGDWKRAWATAMARAELPVGRKAGGYTFHGTRNTFATNLRAAGGSTEDAMLIGGWKDKSMVGHYDLGDVEALRARLEASRGKTVRGKVRRLRG